MGTKASKEHTASVFRIEVPKDEGSSSETLVTIYRNNLEDKNLNLYRRVHPSIPFLQN
jgi:hypothetical protein